MKYHLTSVDLGTSTFDATGDKIVPSVLLTYSDGGQIILPASEVIKDKYLKGNS